MSKDNSLFQNFILPLLLTLLLIVGSLVLDLVNLTNIILTALLFAIIGVSVFFAELMVANVSHRFERKTTFSFLTNLLLSNRTSGGSNILTLEEVYAIEAAAEEVWIYAYDLGWEGEKSKLPDLVYENLTRGVIYRYIIPNKKQVLVRANSLLHKYRNVKNFKKYIRFKSRPLELKLVQFGIAIFNPTVATEESRPISDCVVVFYPQYKSFGPNTEAHFISIRGQSTIEVQEGFVEYWNDAEDIPNLETVSI